MAALIFNEIPVDFRDAVDMGNATSVTYKAASVPGTALTANANVLRSQLSQDALKPYMVPWTHWRVWDALQTNLPGTSASDDLGLYGGTWASASPVIRTYDVKAAGALALYARAQFCLPAEYDGGETITFRMKSQMVTTVADVSCTLDLVLYKADNEAGIGSDLCATAAQSINSLTAANKDFTITPTGLAAGDILDFRIHVAVNDAATATAVIAEIGAAYFLLDVRG